MSDILEQLLIIQDRDRKISRLTRESQDIPQRKQHIETRLEEHEQALHATQEELKKRGLTLKELEGEVEAIKEKIVRLRQQQFEVKNNNDYRILEKEIHHAEKGIGELEEKELGIMEEVEGLKEEAAQAEKALNEEKKLVAQDVQALDQRVKQIENEVNDLKANREELATEVDEDWLSRYQRIFNHTQNVAIVAVENSVCAGCHMKVTPQTVQNARKRTAITLCEYCGRMLYDNR